MTLHRDTLLDNYIFIRPCSSLDMYALKLCESLEPGGGEKSAGTQHKYGRIGTALLVEGEPMEEHVVAKPHPSATPPSAFADRPAYKWWVTWTIMVGSFLIRARTLAYVQSWDTPGTFQRSHLASVSLHQGGTSMATIERRTTQDGQLVYRVKVRRKGHLPQTATFSKLSEARKSA